MSSAILTRPVNVSDAQFKQEVLDSDLPVLVDFWAEWCGPCRMIAPVLVEMAKEHGGKLKIAKLDVDQNPGVAQQYGIMSIPTLMLFKNGKVEEKFIGYMNKAQLEARVLPKL